MTTVELRIKELEAELEALKAVQKQGKNLSYTSTELGTTVINNGCIDSPLSLSELGLLYYLVQTDATEYELKQQFQKEPIEDILKSLLNHKVIQIV
jgi:hypothetical protein